MEFLESTLHVHRVGQMSEKPRLSSLQTLHVNHCQENRRGFKCPTQTLSQGRLRAQDGEGQHGKSPSVTYPSRVPEREQDWRPLLSPEDISESAELKPPLPPWTLPNIGSVLPTAALYPRLSPRVTPSRLCLLWVYVFLTQKTHK